MAYNAEEKLWTVICYVMLCYIDHKVDVTPRHTWPFEVLSREDGEFSLT